MVHVFEGKDELSIAAADLFVRTAKAAVEQNGRFTVALTGGSSPVQLHGLLARDPYLQQVPWQQTFIFWGDERWVPLDDERSNAKMAFDTFLNQVPVPREHIYPMWQEGMAPEAFAEQYEQVLLEHFGGEMPELDLVLLGMGDDGHTASLFPGTEVLHEQAKWVQAYYLEPQSMYRVTLTAPLINRAKTIAFMTFGSNKAKALFEVLEGERNPEQYPSQLIKTDPESVHWLVDKDAAALLKNKG